MAATKWLLVLMTMLASAYSQELSLSGANVLILNTGVPGSPYPVRFYAGVQRTADGSTTARGLVANLDECLRECVNANGAVLPTTTAAVVCNAVDFLSAVPVGATDNCFTHFDPQCSILSTLYTTPVAPTVSTHYKVVHLCDDTRVIQHSDQVSIVTSNLPTGVSISNQATQTNAPDCGLLCNLRLTCIAAEYSTFTGCRHYDTATPGFGDCLPTVSAVGYTTFLFPCNAAPFGGIKVGLVQNAVPRAAVANDFFSCRGLCLTDPECVGYRYNTVGEFIGGLATRCALYDKYLVTQSLGCQPAVQESNMFTIIRTGCQFTQMTDMRKVGGTPQPQWRTLYECERECHYDIMCVGFDWNKDPATRDRDRCWFHTEYRGGCENPRASTMVDHYELIDSRCSINADEYYIFLGVQLSTAGTNQAASATDYNTCLGACNNDNTCEGFEFIIGTPNMCITHTETTVCDSFTPNTAATHYRKWRYECMWRFRNGKRSGGVPQAGVNILGNCERTCRQTVGCEGFDFDRTGRVPGTPCFLHLTGTICNPLVRAADIEHYRVRTRVCPDELNIIAIASWGNAMQNVHTIGNQRQGIEQSAIECAETCVRLGNRQCAGVDYDRRTGFCYIASRNNACQSSASVLNHVDRIQLPTGCNAPPVTGYTGSGSQHRLSGQLRDSNSNPQECATICSGDRLCIAFDFDRTNNECWTHSQTNECRVEFATFNNFCCDHYVNSTFNCNNFNPPIFPSYTLRNMLHVRGGLPVQALLNIVTEWQCITYCNSEASCTSVDFNFERNVCYTHTSATSCDTENTHTKVHRYVKAGNCGF